MIRGGCTLPSVQVRFREGEPLRGGLDALRVLEVGGCTGPLPIACGLPALQASYIVQLHVTVGWYCAQTTM
jgi:hypothetical protein